MRAHTVQAPVPWMPSSTQDVLGVFGKRLTANLTETTTTMQSITGLSVALQANRAYAFRCVLYVNQTVAADGAQFDFDGGTATATTVRRHTLFFNGTGNLVAATAGTAGLADLSTDTVYASTAVTTDSESRTDGFILVNAAGTLIPRFSMEAVSTGVLTVYAGSYIVVWELP